jgi:hypothetical protein
MAALSHSALRDLQYRRGLPQNLYHLPIWLKVLAPTATVHTDASPEAYGATLAHGALEAEMREFYELQGYWDDRYHDRAHIAILELATV